MPGTEFSKVHLLCKTSMESSDFASYSPTLHCAQAVCTEAFCSLEVENSDSEGEEEEESQPSLGLSNLDSPALQVMHWGKCEGEGDWKVKLSNVAGIAPYPISYSPNRSSPSTGLGSVVHGL